MSDSNLKDKKSKKRVKESTDNVAPGSPATAAAPAAAAAAASSSSSPSVSVVPAAVSEAPPNPPQRIDVSQCPIQTVVVFGDRAELTRRVSASLKRGTSEVVVYGIASQTIDTNSIRVSGAVGQATILEVKNAKKPRHREDKKDHEVEKKTAALKEIAERRAALGEQLKVVQDERDWLSAYARSLHAPAPKGDGGKSRLSFEEAASFMRFYAEQRTSLSQREVDLQKKVQDLDETAHEIERNQRKAMELLAKTSPGGADQCEVCIILEAHADTEAKLNLSYILTRASWSSIYDMRVSTSSTEVQLAYHANIVNNTGEDWTDVRIILSTATPSTGGAPPKMQTMFVRPAVRPVFSPYSYGASNRLAPPSQSFAPPPPRASSRKQAEMVNPMLDNSLAVPVSDESEGGGGGGGEGASPRPMGVLTSTVDVKASSFNFTIHRKATIASDNEQHRVTVSVITLSAKFQYTLLPKLTQNAYLRATCDNTSDYPLLEGKLNVFMDGSFATTSELKRTNPGEEFFVHLGVDGTVQVDFKPPKCVTTSSGGMLTTKKTREEHKYVTVIKNTKDFEVSLLVFFQLPKSETDKIQVKLSEPVLKEGDTDTMLNEFNNVRMIFKLGAKKERVIKFEYSVDFANNDAPEGISYS